MVDIINDTLYITSGDVSRVYVDVILPNEDIVKEGDFHLLIPEVSIDVVGEFNGEEWIFDIPPVKKAGRYLYHFRLNDEIVCFPEAVYLKGDRD